MFSSKIKKILYHCRHITFHHITLSGHATMVAPGEASTMLLRFLYFAGAGGISFLETRVCTCIPVCLT
jgi:hypothetical protein